jgi:uncharacterized protein with GYD domain
VVAFTDCCVDYELPVEFETYELLINWTDSIALSVWTDDGHKNLHDFKEIVKKIKNKTTA